MSLSVPTVIRASNDLISEMSTPTIIEQKNVVNLLRCTNRVQKEAFGANTFVLGAAFNKILIPNENIETTQVLACKIPKQWALQASQSLSHETSKVSADIGDVSSRLEKVQLSVNDKYVFCSQDKIRVQLSVNNVLGILLTSVVEIFNNFIGEDNLFKKSVVLIKLWVNFESKRFCYFDLSELFRHDSIVVITMMIFVTRGLQNQPEIENPFAALIYFLEIFSTLDWNNCHVTATSISPNSRGSSQRMQPRRQEFFDASYLPHILHRNKAASTLDRKCAKDELEKLCDSYSQFFASNFNSVDSEQGFGESECLESSGGSNVRDDLSSSSMDSNSRARGPMQSSDVPKADDVCVVMVMDPFAEGRNLCGGCSSIFRKKNTSDQLREVFSKGLQELSILMDPLLQRDQNSVRIPAFSGDFSETDAKEIERDLMQTVFSISNSVRIARIAENKAEELSVDRSSHFSMLYYAMVRNVPPPENNNEVVKSDWLSPTNQTESTHEQFMKNMFDIERMLFRCVQTGSKKVTDESIICLVVQILHQCGPMPIGEIGKQIQFMTRNAEFPKLMKRRFGGLKKFIASHPAHFNCGTNHTFNPVVTSTGYAGPGQQSIVTTNPALYLGGNNHHHLPSTIALLKAAVRDMPPELIETALIKNRQLLGGGGGSNEMNRQLLGLGGGSNEMAMMSSAMHRASLGPSPHSLLQATTTSFPLHPATPSYRNMPPPHDTRDSDSLPAAAASARSERASWPNSPVLRPPHHLDEPSQFHSVVGNINPPAYESQDNLIYSHSRSRGGSYGNNNNTSGSRYDPRIVDGPSQFDMIVGSSRDRGDQQQHHHTHHQLSPPSSGLSQFSQSSSAHGNLALYHHQVIRTNNNNRGLPQQLPPQHIHYNPGHSVDNVLFSNHPNQFHSEHTTTSQRRPYNS